MREYTGEVIGRMEYNERRPGEGHEIGVVFVIFLDGESSETEIVDGKRLIRGFRDQTIGGDTVARLDYFKDRSLSVGVEIKLDDDGLVKSFEFKR
jgi:hypothetical protein